MVPDLSNDPSPSTTVLRTQAKKKVKKQPPQHMGVVTVLFGALIFMSGALIQFTIGGKVAILVIQLGLIIFLIGLSVHTVKILTSVFKEVYKR